MRLNPTMKDIYNSLVGGGERNSNTKWIWKSCFPPKVKLFLWKVVMNALPNGDNLSKRNVVAKFKYLRYNSIGETI